MKNSLLLLIAISGLCLLVACGCGGSYRPPPPIISVALTPNSAPALDASQSDSFTATVSNDSSNQGVNWTVTCPAGISACGAMAQAKSTSGAANQYVAPANASAAETVTVTAASVSDATKSAFVKVTVNPALALVSPAPAQPQPGLVGGSFSFNLVSFVQGGTAPFTWAIKSGTLPAGLTLDAKTGMVAGTPTAATTAAVVMLFTCTDSGNPATTLSANPQISLTINTPAALAITSAAPPDGTMNVNYGPGSIGTLKCFWHQSGAGWIRTCGPCPTSAPCAFPCRPNSHASPCGTTGLIFRFTLTATGGVPGYTWALAPGSSLPPGLTLTTSGAIAGKPTQFGTFNNVAVTVSDSASPVPATKTSAIYKIVIAPPPPPVIDAVPALPIGTLGSPYVGFTFTATNGLSPLTWSETGALPAGLVLSNAGVLSGTPTAAGSFPITVQVQDSAGQNSASQAFTIQILAKGFAPTGSLGDSRVQHVAALLTSGKVLITGGTNDNAVTGPVTAELYDPAAKTFAFTKGSMGIKRVSATATVLKSGKVLVIGGSAPDGTPLATAEIYDPASDTFAPTTGSMQSTRVYHTATLLNDGTVLVAGGLDVSGNSSGVPVATAELFDPTTASFTPVANMGAPRYFHDATLLASGKVLVTGGSISGSMLTTAELYDPVTKTFSLTVGNMTVGRAGHTATLVSGGKVLMAGGAASFGAATATAELFDPATATFSPTTGAMVTARSLHTATLLSNGQVLLAGGDAFFNNGGPQSLSAAELFDPATGSFASTADMTTVRESHTATLLGNGQVLVVGGADSTSGSVLATAELYQ